MNWDERITTLAPCATTGSQYIRAVADSLRTAQRMRRDGRYDEAEYWLSDAEESAQRAGVTA